MVSRAALTALALALIGCAADHARSGNPADDMGAQAGSDMGISHCALVTVTAENDPQSGLPKSAVPALLTATTNVQGVVHPTWSVSRTGDSQSFTPMSTDGSGLTVRYLATDPGTWTFVVSFSSGPCMGMNSITLGNPTGNKVQYRLRALPPESTMLPLKDTALTLVGGTPMMKDLALDSGTPISGVLRGPGGVGTVGEVRLLADSGPDAVTTTNGSGGFALAVLDSGRYRPLLIPQSTALAPHLGAGNQQGIDLANGSWAVGAGETMTGVVTDGSAAPIAGVRVVLRAGALPSGPGSSNAAGAFALHAEAGSYTLAFGSDSWPQASLPGVTVPPGGGSFTVQYTVSRVAVGGTVLASDGKTKLANARVTVVSRSLGAVANVVLGGVTMPASGRISRVVTTDANGALPPMPLVAGSYDVIVEPPAGASDGLSAFKQIVAGAGSWTLILQPPIQLTGLVTTPGGMPVVGARVTAMETVGLGAAPSTTTGNDGRYTLSVDPGAPLQLLVEPGASDKLSGSVTTLPAGSTQADIALGSGLLVTGLVRSPTSAPLRAVRVEALCGSCGSTTPIASAVSDATGTYRLYLPDPGDSVVDGGVTD